MTERPNKRQRSESYGDDKAPAGRGSSNHVPAQAYVALQSFDPVFTLSLCLLKFFGLLHLSFCKKYSS